MTDLYSALQFMNLSHKLLHLILIKYHEVGTNFYSLIRDVKGGLESKSLTEVREPGAFLIPH